MTATGHAFIGLALAAQISNPFIAIPLALISHIAADAFPHWDTGTNIKKKSRAVFVAGSFFDLGMSFVLPFITLFYFFPDLNPLYAFTMIIAAQGFDWATAPYVFLKWQFPPFSWAYRAQKSFDHRLDKPWGVIGQVTIISILLGIAYFL
jgi:membrane-bound metal-dependent hydrolase YbcI (DUF457 family)